MHKNSKTRTCWNLLIAVLLVYTGTVFIYRLCFLDFRIPPPGGDDPYANATQNGGWPAVDWLVTVVFWLDLFANFFFSYDDKNGREIDEVLLIARHYLSTDFAVNMTACIPEQLVEVVIEQFNGDLPDGLNQGVRALRLQRMSRLARLIRLTRLFKLGQQRKSKFIRWFERQKGVRVINLGFGMLWCVHIMACGWYLCAALHEDPSETWVMRRYVDASAETPLITQGPQVQWLHSMYFILTVFSTVGFGDMSAVTTGEIVYVCIVMVVGAVVHSIIISEVISVVTSNDMTNVFVENQMDLVEAFSQHTEMNVDAEDKLKNWVFASAKYWIAHRYDREQMKKLIDGKYMHRELLCALPEALFSGKLSRNRLLTCCLGICTVPPRLPMLLALAVHKSGFRSGEVVYQARDYPYNLYIILRGTFAFVAVPAVHNVAVMDTPCILSGESLLNRSPDHWHERAEGDSSRGGDVHPYMLCSDRSYFGDLELIQNCHRKATVRCESDFGEVLACSQPDFVALAEQFPDIGARWSQAALARERVRNRKERDLRIGRSYRNLAAITIQRQFRRFRRRAAAPKDRDSRFSRNSSHPLWYDMVSTSQITTALLHDHQREMHDEIRALGNGMAELRSMLKSLMTQQAAEVTHV